MNRTVMGIALASACCVPADLWAAGLNYRETWDTYATGNTDTTYTSVWSVSAAPQPTVVNLGSGAVSSPNVLQIEGNRTRKLTNSLTDGITNGTVAGTEMTSGQVVKPLDPASSALNTSTNLSLYHYFITSSTGSDRGRIGTFAELAFGNQHAPLTGSIGAAIPVVAIGKTNGSGNTVTSFFNGLTWQNFGAGVVASAKVFTSMQIFYDAGLSKWRANVGQKVNSGAATFTNFDLAFDPTAQGFDTINWVYDGGNLNAAAYADDIIIGGWSDAISTPSGFPAGGQVVPEPATLGLLALGGLILSRRRRSA